MGRTTVRLLGPLRIECDHQVITTFRSRRVMALLAYTIVEGRSIPRAELAELLWPEKTERQGRANLRWALSQLITLLPGCWEPNRQAVRFVPVEDCRVDVLALSVALKQDDTDALATAVAEAQGDFMAGFFFDESPDFETWLVTARERWRRLVDRALVRLIAFQSQGGHYREALRFARQRLGLDPWIEDSHRTVMRLLAQVGQLDAALDQYEACRRILAEELDVEPAPETTALMERLRRAAAGPRHNLPAQPTEFVGREAELETVSQWLADPDCRLLSLVGPGGIGKTRLALAAAEAQAYHFLDGVTFLSLAGVNPAGPDEARLLLVTTLVDALGLTSSRQQTPRDHLLT
ncbi:MAG: BTAD domain-containing putative transcriptional regulator, partial [Anaerolineae bacterium]